MSRHPGITCYHSLFERLEGHASAQSGGMASVAAHLGKMLSTRAGSAQTASDYGLPDLNDMRQSLHESLSQSRLSIERFIQAYEPRLTNVRVRALPRDRDPLVLAFSIAAMLTIEGETRAVAFSARLGGGGQVEVTPDGP
jgi:type VI secretion system protein